MGCRPSALLQRTFAFEPSSDKIAASYLKLVTVPSFSFNCDLSLDAIALLVISLVSLALISVLYYVQVLLRLSNRATRSCSSSARASMLSAYCKLVIVLPVLTFPKCSSRA